MTTPNIQIANVLAMAERARQDALTPQDRERIASLLGCLAGSFGDLDLGIDDGDGGPDSSDIADALFDAMGRVGLMVL